ncbi:MAG: LysE family translocator [Alicyclobacillus sp.]|nr:LysE family translocator [Alicyclobacillus sp.]
MLALVITAFGMGFVYSAAPGAVNTEALRRGLQRGFVPAFLVQVGALIGDLMWAGIGLTGVALVFRFWPVQVILGIAGVAFLLRMAWLSFLDARKSIAWTTDAKQREQRHFVTGMIFSVANPFGFAFWGGIGGSFATQMASLSLIDKLATLFVGFAVGAFAWCIGISALVGWSRQFVGPKVLRGVYTVSSLAMAYFALEMLWTLVHHTLYPLFVHRWRFRASS